MNQIIEETPTVAGSGQQPGRFPPRTDSMFADDDPERAAMLERARKTNERIRREQQAALTKQARDAGFGSVREYQEWAKTLPPAERPPGWSGVPTIS
jgi:hypothetical protein